MEMKNKSSQTILFCSMFTAHRLREKKKIGSQVYKDCDTSCTTCPQQFSGNQEKKALQNTLPYDSWMKTVLLSRCFEKIDKSPPEWWDIDFEFAEHLAVKNRKTFTGQVERVVN